MLRIKQVKGSAKLTKRVKETLKGLGLRHCGVEVTLKDTPAIRGMLEKVKHLVEYQIENS